jgi:hypothetical protein
MNKIKNTHLKFSYATAKFFLSNCNTPPPKKEKNTNKINCSFLQRLSGEVAGYVSQTELQEIRMSLSNSNNLKVRRDSVH